MNLPSVHQNYLVHSVSPWTIVGIGAAIAAGAVVYACWPEIKAAGKRAFNPDAEIEGTAE